MEELKALIEELMTREELLKGVISNRRKQSTPPYRKIDIKPVLIKGERLYQWALQVDRQVLHENLSPDQTRARLLEEAGHFRQMLLCTEASDYQVLISKKGKVKVIPQRPTLQVVDLSHDRRKQRILEEGTPYPFLVHLGVMTEEGKVKSKRFDKFRQLNRYLEIVRDAVGALEGKRARIVDFGCGKAYLTFALYHYLVNELGWDVEIIGLDLKDDVITFGNEVAKAVGFDRLQFMHGDIHSFSSEKPVDMVISLHACDTATDDALIKGIGWEAKVILTVPCCQHELNPIVDSEALNGLLKYGIYRERVAALLTDALRASLLEQAGYRVDAVEFVAMEHTAKNIMIRAVWTGQVNQQAQKEYELLKTSFGIKNFHMERHL